MSRDIKVPVGYGRHEQPHKQLVEGAADRCGTTYPTYPDLLPSSANSLSSDRTVSANVDMDCLKKSPSTTKATSSSRAISLEKILLVPIAVFLGNL